MSENSFPFPDGAILVDSDIDNSFTAAFLHHLATEFVQQNRANAGLEAPAFDEQTALNLSSENMPRIDENLEPTRGALRVIGVLDSQKKFFKALAIVDLAQLKIELEVLPEFRRQGLGTLLLKHLVQNLGADFNNFTFWAHGDLPGSQKLAEKYGLTAYRRLLVLEKDLASSELTSDLELSLAKDQELCLPAGFSLRPINTENIDELEALVELNEVAFRGHPEQGKLQLMDFRERFSQSWFDAQLFFGVFDDLKLAAYLWLKPESHQELELYVLGVSPEYQGRGLGAKLTRIALERALRDNYERLCLYVDAGNTAAMATYTRAGFTQRERHFAYRKF